MSDYPDVEKLVPHARPMMLLDEVLEANEDHIVCKVVVRSDGLFDRQNEVPGWLGLEYMAQTVAAFSGWRNWQAGQSTKVGLLLGTRRFTSIGTGFRVGEELIVRAELVIEATSGMSAFDCRVSGQDVEQVSTLSVYEPPNADELLRQGDSD